MGNWRLPIADCRLPIADCRVWNVRMRSGYAAGAGSALANDNGARMVSTRGGRIGSDAPNLRSALVWRSAASWDNSRSGDGVSVVSRRF